MIIIEINLKLDDKLPEFSCKNQDETEISIKDLEGKWTVLYFYPKDNTPGCTLEAIEFSQKKEEFEKLGVEIIGVSKDNIKSHQKFIENQELKINLLSDTEQNLINTFGVLKEKSMFGKKYMGIVRSTFIINPKLEIKHIWLDVKVKGHVEEVLNKVKELV